MIVCTQRASNEPGGRWLIFDRAGTVLDAFEPTPAVLALLESGFGYFEAEKTAKGWQFARRVPDPAW
jgi:hypothetical protein